VRPAAQGPAHREQAVPPFNRLFARITRAYTGTVGLTLKHGIIGGLIFALVIGADLRFLPRHPGQLRALRRPGLPDLGADAAGRRHPEAHRSVPAQACAPMAQDPAVKHTFVVSGFDLIGGGNKPNAGTIFIPLKDWSQRQAKAQDLAGKFMGIGMMQADGMALVFNPPPIMGLGTAGGFEVYLQNRVDGDPRKLNEVAQQFIADLQKHPEFTRISTFFRPTVPQLFVESTSRRRWRSAFRWPASTSRCKAPWARCTSTTSTRPAASIACSCRPRPATA
jgi:multidrug efflux pump subunit AcrB